MQVRFGVGELQNRRFLKIIEDRQLKRGSPSLVEARIKVFHRINKAPKNFKVFVAFRTSYSDDRLLNWCVNYGQLDFNSELQGVIIIYLGGLLLLLLSQKFCNIVTICNNSTHNLDLIKKIYTYLGAVRLIICQQRQI